MKTPLYRSVIRENAIPASFATGSRCDVVLSMVAVPEGMRETWSVRRAVAPVEEGTVNTFPAKTCFCGGLNLAVIRL